VTGSPVATIQLGIARASRASAEIAVAPVRSARGGPAGCEGVIEGVIAALRLFVVFMGLFKKT